MVFDTITTEEKFFNFKHPKTYTYLSLAILLVALLIDYINKEYLFLNIIRTIFLPIIIISLIVFLIAQLFTIFSKEDILITYTGKLKINADEFIIDNEKINFKDIISIELSIDDYEGRSINLHSSTEPMFSKGVENFIKISTDHKKIEKQIQLSSLRETQLISNFLAAQIVKNKFVKTNTKQLIAIFSDQFKKTKDARNFIASKIKEGEINSTEGLLMMNYSSDIEAKELRKKHNL